MEKFYCEKISYYKLLLTASITAFYGCCGWFYVNKAFLNPMDIALIISLMLLLPGIIVAIIYKIRFYIDKLKKESY